MNDRNGFTGTDGKRCDIAPGSYLRVWFVSVGQMARAGLWLNIAAALAITGSSISAAVL